MQALKLKENINKEVLESFVFERILKQFKEEGQVNENPTLFASYAALLPQYSLEVERIYTLSLLDLTEAKEVNTKIIVDSLFKSWEFKEWMEDFYVRNTPESLAD